jgi:hypothetical protein
LEAARSLTRVDACNPLLQAHPTWAQDEHEGRGIPTSLTPVSGRLASPPSRSPSRSTHLGWDTRRHSLVGPRDPRSRNADKVLIKGYKVFLFYDWVLNCDTQAAPSNIINLLMKLNQCQMFFSITLLQQCI